MHLGMGGNPYGPAGTGKTESVKALGNLFGRQVLVFNCDEGIDVKSMGRIFVGKSDIGSFCLIFVRIGQNQTEFLKVWVNVVVQKLNHVVS